MVRDLLFAPYYSLHISCHLLSLPTQLNMDIRLQMIIKEMNIFYKQGSWYRENYQKCSNLITRIFQKPKQTTDVQSMLRTLHNCFPVRIRTQYLVLGNSIQHKQIAGYSLEQKRQRSQRYKYLHSLLPLYRNVFVRNLRLPKL